MNNLKNIRNQVLHMTMDELKDKMKISRQLLYTWETGKVEIPEKRLKQLEDITGIPTAFFVMENITEEDLKKAKRYKLEKEFGKTMHLEEEEEELEEQDEQQLEIDLMILEQVEKNLKELNLKDLQDKLRNVIFSIDTVVAPIGDDFEGMLEKREAVDRFLDILAAAKNRKLVFQMVRVLELSLKVNEEKYQIFGEENTMVSNRFPDQAPIIIEMRKVISKHYNAEIENLNRQIEELKKMISKLENQ